MSPSSLGRSWDQPDLEIPPDPRKLSDLPTVVHFRCQPLALDSSGLHDGLPAATPTLPSPVGSPPEAREVSIKSPSDPVAPPRGPRRLPSTNRSPYDGREALSHLPSDHPASLIHRTRPLLAWFWPLCPTPSRRVASLCPCLVVLRSQLNITSCDS